MFRLVLIIYNILFPALFLLYLPFYLRKLMRRGNWRQGFWERFGRYRQEKRKALASLQDPIWIHAVSVGETVAALSFIQTWRDRDPKQAFVLSTTTSTGQQIAREKAPADVEVIYFPMDFLPCVNAALKCIKPSQLVIFEVEVWPTIIRTATRRNIPVSLVNCRMSDNSSRGYARHRWFFQPIFASFQEIAVQTEQDARRVAAVLGHRDNVTVCGTMKFDQVSDRESVDIHALLNRVFPRERLIFCAASTHAPEETLLAHIIPALVKDYPQLRVILVPRHQERSNEVEQVLQTEGVDYFLRTELDADDDPHSATVLLVNTTGELMNFMAASDIVFVGKSLADYGGDGGHNIIEPAIFGRPILHGPAMENFRDVAAIFHAENAAVEVADEAGLEAELRRLIENADAREALGEASRNTVEKHRGAINQTIDLLC